MGHKVNPQCLRLNISRDWRARWFMPSKKMFFNALQEDRKIRELLEKELSSAAVARVTIERSIDKVRVVQALSEPMEQLTGDVEQCERKHRRRRFVECLPLSHRVARCGRTVGEANQLFERHWLATGHSLCKTTV